MNLIINEISFFENHHVTCCNAYLPPCLMKSLLTFGRDERLTELSWSLKKYNLFPEYLLLQSGLLSIFLHVEGSFSFVKVICELVWFITHKRICGYFDWNVVLLCVFFRLWNDIHNIEKKDCFSLFPVKKSLVNMPGVDRIGESWSERQLVRYLTVY